MPTQVDDELEKYAAKPSGDDELEKYAQKAAPKSGSLEEYLSTPHTGGTDTTNELEKQTEKENLTPRMRAAVSSGAATMAAPTRFEKEHTPAPEDTGWMGRLKQYGSDIGNMVAGIPQMFSGPVVTPGKIADIAAGYSRRAVPNTSQEGLSGARSPLYNAIATGAEATGLAGPSAMEESAEHGDPAGVLTHTAAQLTPLAVAEAARIPAVRKATGAIADTARAIPEKAALALRTEEGALKPGARATVQAGAGLVGAAPGLVHGNIPLALAGGAAAARLAPYVADRLIPNLPTDIPVKPGATSGVLPSIDEFYANRAEDLAKRGKEQATIDKAAAREQTAQEKAAAKEGKAVPITQSPYYNQNIEALKAQAEAAKPKIISATEGEPRPTTESEGRGATWTNEAVLEEAAKGNRTGITQAIRRKLPMPPNTRYVMGDPDYPRAVLNPREVTLFSPEGIPIRNKANAQAEAQPGGIPTIARTPRGTIPNIGEGVPQGAALPFPGPLPETSTPLAAAPLVEAAPEPVAAPKPMDIKPLEDVKPIMEPTEAEPVETKIKGITAEEPKAKAAKREKLEPIEKRYSQQAIIDAEGLLASEAGASAAGERPGRYYDESEAGDVRLRSRGAQTKGGDWRGVKSGRNMFPFLRENPDVNPATIERALRNKDSAAYNRLIEKAIEFNRRTNPDLAYDFIQSLGENPDAEPEETAAQPEAPKAGTIPKIGSAFKVSTTKPIAPPDLEPLLKESGWSYKGKDATGMHTFEEPGTNIKLRLLDRDLNPDFVRRKMAEKEKQYGGPKEGEAPF